MHQQHQPQQQVLSVAAEMHPLVKTGGLADVAGALPEAMAGHGVQMTTLLPGYPAVLDALSAPRVVGMLAGIGGPARLLAGRVGAAEMLALDAPQLYARPGNPYLAADGRDWPDNALRFAALAQAAAQIAGGAVAGLAPRLLHLHDWHAALVPAYLRSGPTAGRRVPTVLTLHNLAFQGLFPANQFSDLGLPASDFSPEALEFHGRIGFLKAGLLMADAITTVSPSYAREILRPDQGMGLDAILRWRDMQGALQGIVNGIDLGIWNPASDLALAARYDAHQLDERRANRRALESHFGLAHEEQGLLCCVVSRLTEQKGMDLLLDALDALSALDARLIVLGSGDAAMQARWLAAAQRWPGRVAVQIGYDETLSHLMQGGADAIIVPSRFEPCGLTQLYGLRYGCVPVVAHVGGLADTVIDANPAALDAGVATGIQFSEVSREGLVEALRRCALLHAQPEVWAAIQRAGMRANVGWERSAASYAALYRQLLARDPVPKA